MKLKYAKYGVIGIVGVAHTVNASVEPEKVNTRLFGKPGSIEEGFEEKNNILRLSMKKSKLPTEIWKDIEKLSGMWQMINAKDVKNDYLKHYKNTNLTSNSKSAIEQTFEHRVLLAMADDSIQNLVRLNDYEGIIIELDKRGLIYHDDESSLTNKLQAALSQDEELKRSVSNALGRVHHSHDESDIVYLNRVIEPIGVSPQSGVAAAAVLVVVALGVATYVAAAVNVAAALNLAIQLSIAINVAVTVGGSGGGGGGGQCNGCHNQSSSMSVGLMDSKMTHNYTIMNDLANIGFNGYLHSRSAIEFKKKEARAVLSAALNLGLIKIPDSEIKSVFEAIDRITVDSLTY